MIDTTPTRRACPTCGETHKISAWRRDVCPSCATVGHWYRMLTAEELRTYAQEWRARGYEHTAQRYERLADWLDKSGK